MGGFGSGRKNDAKSVVSTYWCIDIGHLKKHGALKPECEFTLRYLPSNNAITGKAEGAAVWFSYAVRQGGNFEDQLYKVPLCYTPGQFGGERPWFLCPQACCGKRVRKLYITMRLGCRHCLKLSFQSKNENHMDRMARKADNLRAKLGWPLGILHPEGGKPKGMHNKTFSRLLQQYRVQQKIALCAIVDEFPTIKARFIS